MDILTLSYLALVPFVYGVVLAQELKTSNQQQSPLANVKTPNMASFRASIWVWAFSAPELRGFALLSRSF
jgi:hypothetical protein